MRFAAAPAPTPIMEDGKTITAEPSPQDSGPPDDSYQLDVLLRGNRLQITADVDANSLVKLKEVVAKYEEILKLLEK
jgi:hypothetical protein